MKAKWHGKPYHDHGTRKWLVTLELDTAPEIYDQTQDADLNVEIKKWREKRSLNANSYFHVLVDKIAAVQGLSHAEVHNKMIADYGFMDEEIKNLIMDADIPWQRLETIHLMPTSYTKLMENGKLYRVFIVMRGSHTYNTTEMARLIDGTVYEAKELGIETIPPNEIELLKAMWR